ncbi:hypothetical protein [Paraliobacillus ryukyuensis]|uniref:hypothetical protein n=1 Tax=Paraliobacillus ryukyuensis TaxID=200904 RepID=UPI0009A6E70C|nr:hypothetical protein [Paraliobacillus ryukyuensis]
MKRWLVIGVSVTAISVWVLFFFLLIGQTDPKLASNQKEVTYQKVKINAQHGQFARFEDHSNDANTVKQSEQKKSAKPKNEQKESSPTQDIMYDLEKSNPVSIDNLLAELNIE